MDGENDKNKVAQYIGSLAYNLEKLELGEFFYDFGSTTKWIYTEEFKPKTKPMQIESAKEERPILVSKPKKTDQETAKALTNVIIAILWLVAIAIGASQLW